jgi:hypothetical protein
VDRKAPGEEVASSRARRAVSAISSGPTGVSTHTNWSRMFLDLSYSERRGTGSMIAIDVGLDCRYAGKDVDFLLFGAEEYDPIAGRGWAIV